MSFVYSHEMKGDVDLGGEQLVEIVDHVGDRGQGAADDPARDIQDGFQQQFDGVEQSVDGRGQEIRGAMGRGEHLGEIGSELVGGRLELPAAAEAGKETVDEVLQRVPGLVGRGACRCADAGVGQVALHGVAAPGALHRVGGGRVGCCGWGLVGGVLGAALAFELAERRLPCELALELVDEVADLLVAPADVEVERWYSGVLDGRCQARRLQVYDPLGLAGVPGARWTPLAHCRTYSDARRVGRMLADAADIGGHRAEDANYWQLLGAKLLSVLLFAAAGTGRSMADVARWVDVQDVDDVATALMEIGNQQALDAWAACTSRPDNTMGSVYGTAETLLDVYGDPTVAASAEGCDLDLDQLLTGANNTLYLYAPASEQERLRPLFELLVSVVIWKAEELAAAQPDGMLDPRLFVCLDEAGNCAAIKKLPQLATTGRGQGIQLLTIWHDEAQLAHRYGHRASTVLNGHRAKLLLSGQADPASLELASKLVGDEAVVQTSETTGGDGRASLTESTAYRRMLPPEALRQLKPRRALLVYGHLPPVRIRLRPRFRSRRLVTLAMAVDAAVPHPAMQVDDLAPVEPLHRAGEDGEVAA